MKCAILATWLTFAVCLWGLSGCGAADDKQGEGATGAEELAVCGTTSCSPPVCPLPICQKLSLSDITGTCCTCAEFGVDWGVLRADISLVPHTYFCRAQ